MESLATASHVAPTAPSCIHCDDTYSCRGCGGYGELMGLYGYPYACSDCHGAGYCIECCCSECIHGHGIAPCNHEDDE